MDVFRRAADAGAQLLGVDRSEEPESEGGSRAGRFLLTFDIGRVLVSAGTSRDRLAAEPLQDPQERPPGLRAASEEEPWWRLLGCSLVGAEPAQDASRVRLRFRISGGRERILALGVDAGGVRAAIEGDAGGA